MTYLLNDAVSPPDYDCSDPHFFAETRSVKLEPRVSEPRTQYAGAFTKCLRRAFVAD